MKAGYTQPDFSDYFHLTEGDVIYWESRRTNGSPWDNITYYRDSITYSFISDDSVYYEMEVKSYDENGDLGTVSNAPVYYHRQGYEILSGISSSYSDVNNVNDFVYSFDVLFGVNDTVTEFSYIMGGVLLRDCEISAIADIVTDSRKYSTQLGYAGYYSSWSDRSYKEIIGFEINGKVEGNGIPTGISSSTNINFNVFPNPFTDLISVESEQELSKVDLVTVQGELILESNDVSQINTSNLASGIYFLRFYNEQGLIGIQKVVK